MKVIEFIFAFLFIRNWHTGEIELSRPRLILFSGMLFIILLGILLALVLQTPMEYVRSTSL